MRCTACGAHMQEVWECMESKGEEKNKNKHTLYSLLVFQQDSSPTLSVCLNIIPSEGMEWEDVSLTRVAFNNTFTNLV